MAEMIETNSSVPSATIETPQYNEQHKKEIIKNKTPRTRLLPGDELYNRVQEFCEKVDIIVHTVNGNEKYAVLDLFKPPEFSDKTVDLHEPDYITLGMFGGYKAALIQTEMGADSRGELEQVYKEFPNTKLFIAIGVAWGADRKKYKYGDVLVSKFIDGIGNIKYDRNGLILARPSNTRYFSLPQLLKNVFTKTPETWSAIVEFKCTQEGRESKVHCGLMISGHALVDNEEVKEKITANAPEAIGGEMEGVQLLQLDNNAERSFGVIVIKGVADYGDGEKGKKWQFTAAKAAASYAHHKLEKTDGKIFLENVQASSSTGTFNQTSGTRDVTVATGTNQPCGTGRTTKPKISGSTPLTLKSAFDLLKNKSAEWNSIGEALDVSLNDRESLRRDQTINDTSRLEKVLYQWIESSVPTWSSFVDILSKSKFTTVVEEAKKIVNF